MALQFAPEFVRAQHGKTMQPDASCDAIRSSPFIDPAEVLSVAALNRLARQRLETSFPLLRVEGEISNLSRAASGHLYFTLKDADAQVRCTMWRNRAQLLAFQPENGMRVEVRANVTLYEARGDFQLAVERIGKAGQGRLHEAFLQLKARLAAEGLFDPAAKRALPRFPARIGVVTSPAAAALQDVLASLARRSPFVEVLLYPAAVQGVQAAEALTNALRSINARPHDDKVDVVLLVRGGGSMEDLAAFNDERLARAIRATPVPVISGVGHETDFTIADFVADVRATTPTMAAELASAGFVEAANALPALARKLEQEMARTLASRAQRLDRASLRLLHPRERLAHAAGHLDRLRQRLIGATALQLERAHTRHDRLALRLRAAAPRPAGELGRIHRHGAALTRAMASFLSRRDERLAALGSHLAHLDPRAVLQRGYSITRGQDGRILLDAARAVPGAAITVQLAHGSLAATVTASAPAEPRE